ncbi:unnamed protein product [Adineta ricciae]|uniref:Uncharacterized protein n=1 Tax=Adineta ricciae TaxID=249248 RepID=A0A814T7T6_ADIRI|nr:unnamed protein product [Adineta ricciae]CAF1372721.1 unnamed protein product [Adineta ricciae]
MTMKDFSVFLVCAVLLFSNVNASAVQETADDEVQERFIPVVAAVIARVVTILGPRVTIFATCMGGAFTLECGQKMLDCAMRGKAPWECIGGLWCSGKSAANCAKLSG